MQRLKIKRDAEVEVKTEAGLFDGVVTLKAPATAIDEGEWSGLYRTKPPAERESSLTAIPYYLWANRGQGSMVVWIPEVV